MGRSRPGAKFLAKQDGISPAQPFSRIETVLSITRCSRAFGHATVLDNDPAISIVNAVLVPGYWGLYDHGHRLITNSAYFRGPTPDVQNAAYSLGNKWPVQVDEAPDDNYFYLGPIHKHYGHFLLSTFSRLWPLDRKNCAGLRLVTPTKMDVEAHPFMRLCLSALGLSKENIHFVERPTRFKRIVVAAPSFEEQNFVHHAYARLCDRVAAAATVGHSAVTNSKPCYLAKFGMDSGVGRIENEEVVADRLSRSGIEIVFPEQMAFAEQIILFRDREATAGIIGSAFHTASFAQRSRMLMLAYGSAILSNQILIDRLRQNDAHYVYDRNGLTQSEHAGFSSAWLFKEPAAVADDFMRVFDTLLKRGGSESTGLAPTASSGKQRRNIALGCPTRQSSISEHSLPLDANDASRGAVSGYCTGGFQFHTALEAEPWWQVDLGGPRTISEVQLYNRLDGCMHRAAKFTIKLSFDGTTWTDAFSKNNEELFGGLGGHPFCWLPDEPVYGRFVRIALLQTTYFHLDQVAVFGPDTALHAESPTTGYLEEFTRLSDP